MGLTKFDPIQYDQDKAAFIGGFLSLIETFLGTENVPDLVTFARPEDTKKSAKTILEKTLDALPDLVFEGTWDLANGEIENDLEYILHACQLTRDAVYFVTESSWSKDFDLILKTANARTRLHYFGSCDFEDLALLANMSVASVKNAQYNKGDDCLIVGDSGSVSSEDAWRWLQGRRNFKPTRFYDSRFETLEPITDINSLLELKNMLRGRIKVMNITTQNVVDAFEGTISKGVVEREFLSKDYEQYPIVDDQPLKVEDYLDLLKPKVCANLAKMLKLDPSWFVLKAINITSQAFAERLVQARESDAHKALEAMGLPHYFSTDKPVDPDEIPTAEKIRQVLESHSNLSYHPKFKKGNAKIEAYLADNGRSIAHEYNLRNQAVWLCLDGISTEVINNLIYIRHTPDCEKHSGLNKYPEFSQGHLTKFYPRSMAEVMQIAEAITKAQPVNKSESEEVQ